jgi:hypothetical protein
VANSSGQPIWVGGGGGALRAICVVNANEQCIPEENHYAPDSCSCFNGSTYDPGTPACPGTSHTIDGKNCIISKGQNCGDAQANVQNNKCFYQLPDAPKRFVGFTPTQPWNWEVPQAGEVDFCLPSSTVSWQGQQLRSTVWWSGGVFARTGCLSDGTNCASGDCTTCRPVSEAFKCETLPNANCGAGTGGAKPFVIAEFTLQRTANDFYDVTTINGANVAEEMAPIGPLPPVPPNSPPNFANYWCKAPGSPSSGDSTKDCDWDFGKYIKEVPVPTATATTDATSLLMYTTHKCAVNSGAATPDCPADNYQCAGYSPTNAQAKNGTCYKSCTSESDCPGNLKCLPEVGQPGVSYCQCETDADCSDPRSGGPHCGTQFVQGIESPQETYLQECGNFSGWWTADDFCGRAVNVVGQNGSAQIKCNQSITNGDTTTTNFATLIGCAVVGNGTPSNNQSCYTGTLTSTACCGCATDPSNTLSEYWPTDPYPLRPEGSCQNNTGQVNNNSGWASDIQPWLVNIKRACPTSYVFAYDDFTSTYQCRSAGGGTNTIGYKITFLPLVPPK